MHTLRSTGSANKVCVRALAILLLVLPFPAKAQSRGVYPLGMSSTNSGVTPASGFTYSNQLLSTTATNPKIKTASPSPSPEAMRC